MEYLFENKCNIDQKMMTESVRSNRRVFIVLTAIPLVVTALGILGLLAKTVVKGDFDLPALLRWVIFFLIFLRVATSPRRTARRVLRDFKRVYKVEQVESTTQVGDTIVYTIQGSEPCEYTFDSIKKVIASKNCFLLIYKKRVMVEVDPQGKEHYVNKKGTLILARDGFTQGDFESFKAYLREKCPKVKIPE